MRAGLAQGKCVCLYKMVARRWAEGEREGEREVRGAEERGSRGGPGPGQGAWQVCSCTCPTPPPPGWLCQEESGRA